MSTKLYDKIILKLEWGPMPNVMVALHNIGGALCSTPKVLLTLTTWLPCSSAAKMQKPSTLVASWGAPNYRTDLSCYGRSSYCGDIWRRYCCL